MKATYVIIAGDEMKSDLMQICDVFSKDKFVATPYRMIVTFKTKKLTLKTAGVQIEKIKLTLGQSGMMPIFVHLESIASKNAIILNNAVNPFLDKKVRVISDGKAWIMMKDFLEKLDLKVKTDKNFFITEVQVKKN